MRLIASVFFGLICLSLAAADDSQATGSIVGKVVNQKGELMPDVPLKLYLPRGMKDRPPTTQPIKGGKEPYIVGSTDQQGQFVFTDLPAGEYAVVADLEGTGRGRVVVVVRENKRMKVQIMLISRRGEKQ